MSSRKKTYFVPAATIPQVFAMYYGPLYKNNTQTNIGVSVLFALILSFRAKSNHLVAICESEKKNASPGFFLPVSTTPRKSCLKNVDNKMFCKANSC